VLQGRTQQASTQADTLVAAPTVTAPTHPRASPVVASPEPDNAALWGAVEPANYKTLPYLRGDVEGARLVALAPLLRQIKPGDELLLPIPQLPDPLDVVITRETINASGSRSLQGSLRDDPRFGVVLTLGETTTFATLSTPAGIYNLRGGLDLAWIVSSRELNKVIDPSVPDYVVVK
jgi:hypothetical protein